MIIAIIFLIVMGLVGGLTYWQIQRTNPNNMNKKSSQVNSEETVQQNNQNIDNSTAQSFLPFEHLEDNVLVRKGEKYSMYIECSSINYGLKTEEEQDLLESSFAQFLGGIKTPISFFIQTKEIDTKKRYTYAKERISETIETFPQLRDLSREYLGMIREFKEITKNPKEKKKYIIVTFDEKFDIPNMNKEQRVVNAIKEIKQITANINSSLRKMGIEGKILSKKEIIEFLLSITERDNNAYQESLSNEELTSYMVGKEGNFRKLDEKEEMELAISESMNRIGLLTKNQNNKKVLDKALEILDTLKETKEEIINSDLEDENKEKDNFWED